VLFRELSDERPDVSLQSGVIDFVFGEHDFAKITERRSWPISAQIRAPTGSLGSRNADTPLKFGDRGRWP